MTEKQTTIIKIALLLFGKNGYDGTSTKQIAIEAGVSEGLIFRHFKNKEGLLFSIIQDAKAKTLKEIQLLVATNTPKDALRQIFSFPFHMDENSQQLWRLIYRLKWQSNFDNTQLVQPYHQLLTEIFEELNYSNPEVEAIFAFTLIDGIMMKILLSENTSSSELLTVLFNKYEL